MTGAKLPHFTWAQVIRLGLVQACLGSVVVMTTSTLNRVMVVELALPARVPGLLVALHYALQLARPRMGHGSDVGVRRTPWILGGQITLAVGGVVAAIATAWMGTQQAPGLALAVLGFVLIGLGVSACGTSLLVLLAKRVAPERRAAAATVVWVMMIFGFAVTAGVAGKLLDPYSPARLVSVMAGVSTLAVIVTMLALWRLEGEGRAEVAASGSASGGQAASPAPKPSFREALRITWAEAAARRFTVFVFVSMLAYSAQDLILEPFAGVVFGFTPGQSTSLSGTQHGGVLLGMLMAGLAGSRVAGRRFGSLKTWTVGGCVASALAMAALVVAGLIGPPAPLSPIVFVLGMANGAFSIAAIGSMMKLASEGGEGREGVRMGLWGAAQGIAFGAGGFLGTVASDLAHALVGSPAMAYGSVFAVEAMLFVVAAWIAMRVGLAAPPALAGANANATRASRPAAVNLPSSEPDMDEFDVVVVGGGPAGATAAQDLARAGRRVLLLDRAGRIKPCGGAIPPRAMLDFDIPESMLVARARCARMVAPKGRHVDIPIEGGYVGLVDREHFDEWLRERARASGAERRPGRFEALERDAHGVAIVVYRQLGADRPEGEIAPLVRVRARTVIGADGARSEVARQAQIPGADRTPFVFAYHEILQSPEPGTPGWDGSRCDVIYRGSISPDFYGWVFPHGNTLSVGTGSADKGYSLRNATQRLRRDAGLEHLPTIRREGAPIPLKPLPKWDNGRDVVLAGDAAGVVAPASGEGIYYAMTGGRYAADAVQQVLNTGSAKALATARQRFMREHGRVFWVLGILQRFWYSSDKRRERFVAICEDKDVQQLTFDAYMNKRLVRAKPLAHVRIFFKDMAHLLGLARV